ncbi:MAG: hypothetical protein WCP85_23860 [Mariniphaga sp.]
MKIIPIFMLLFIFTSCVNGQQQSFQVTIKPFQISGLVGIQSFAIGHSDGKWLILGGRLDGLHRRQPWATFDKAGQNDQLIVVDPVEQKKWSAPLTSLPIPIQEQLSSTNMEFQQDGAYLYVTGGYGYSNSEGDHITYPYLTVIKVSEVIKSIIAETPFTTYFRQIKDQQFAVTGGALNNIDSTYYLTGGQRFDGRYNPMNHPTFRQEYTNSIRKFHINDNGSDLSVRHLEGAIDTMNLHRRDFNVIPQIMPDGSQGLTAFSGVFQFNADLPYLNCVNIDRSGYKVNNDFAQYYNQYQCAHIPLYSAEANEMHNLFFGGIAQYRDSAGIRLQNNDVPFVKTITRVTRNSTGKMTENKLPIEMPGFLGAGAEFILAGNLPLYGNEVIKLDVLRPDTTLLGYIYGGINSSIPNIFWINDGTQSVTSSTIFKVYIVKEPVSKENKL